MASLWTGGVLATESIADSMTKHATNTFWLRGTSRDILLSDMLCVFMIR
jgi:hypothetical protein